MYVVVPVCCFCEKVRDDDCRGDAAWVSLKEYRAKYGLLPGEVWGSHTECPSCGSHYDQLVSRHGAPAGAASSL